MEMDLITAISNVGFPIAVASYMIFKMETTMKKLTNSIDTAIMIMSGKLPPPKTS